MEDRTFHFIHLTFQEFFAAQYFVQCWMCNEWLPIRDRIRAGGLSSHLAPGIAPEDFVRAEKYTERYNIFWRFVVGLLDDESDKAQVKRFYCLLEDEPLDLVGLSHQRLIIYCLSEVRLADRELQSYRRALEERYILWAQRQLQLSNEQNSRYSPNSLIVETECSDYILERLLDDVDNE